MDEAQRREADVHFLTMEIEQLRTAAELLPEGERHIAFLGGVLQLLVQLPPENPLNYVEHKYLCDTYEQSPGYEAALVMDRVYIKIMSARASLLASVDQWLSPEERGKHFASVREKLTSAGHLLLAGECESLRGEVATVERLASGVAEGAISTCVRFDIPTVLPIPDGAYRIRIEDKHAYIRVSYNVPGAQRFGTVISGPSVMVPRLPSGALDWLHLHQSQHVNKVELLFAKRATVGFTSVIVTLPGYVNPVSYEQWGQDELQNFDLDNPPPAKSFSTALHESMNRVKDPPLPKALQTSIWLLNRLIDEIRLSGKRYDIERIVPGDIEGAVVGCLVRGWPWFSFTSGFVHQSITGKDFAHDWVDSMRTNLLSGSEAPVERFLVLDARKLLVYGELRLSVLNINAAFEAFVNRHFHDRMTGILTKAEIDAFLDGSSIFESCRSELIRMAKRDRSAGIAADLLPTRMVSAEHRWKAPINKVVLEMNRRLSFGISNTQLNKLVHQIRRDRNDVAHGRFGDADLEKVNVQGSLDALERFIELAIASLSAHRTATTTHPLTDSSC